MPDEKIDYLIGNCIVGAIFAAILSVMILIVLVLCITSLRAQEHKHPPQDRAVHEKFYSTWMMPDQPQTSCCNERDCYPTEARQTADGWLAQRREDGKWLAVPDNKIERHRDSPDGRNHLCAPPPMYGDKVYCFSVGGGT